MRRKRWIMACLVLLLLAGCGQAPAPQTTEPSAPPALKNTLPPLLPTAEAYPPLPTATARSTPIPVVTTLPAPQLEIQLLSEEWREGERIAFLRDQDLWLVRPDGSALAQVTTSENVTALYGWSLDCTQLLLGVGERPVPLETEELGGRDLWVVQIDDFQARPLVPGLEVLSAIWSPVGNQISYGTRDGNIHLVNSDGTEYRTLLDNHIGFLGSWSPDGTKIAFQHMPTPMDFWTLNLSVLDIATGEVLLPIPEATNHIDSLPYLWSVDGGLILFQSSRDGNHVWWSLDLELGHFHPLENEGLEAFQVVASGIARSPVDDQVAFGYYRFATDTPIIWVMDFNGDNLHQLAEGVNPGWSPDGQKIAYLGSRGELGVVNLDGTRAIQITEIPSTSYLYRPAWCQGGKGR